MPGCHVDYGKGRVLFAGEAAGFLNPMGEGISAGLESGHAAARANSSIWNRSTTKTGSVTATNGYHAPVNI